MYRYSAHLIKPFTVCLPLKLIPYMKPFNSLALSYSPVYCTNNNNVSSNLFLPHSQYQPIQEYNSETARDFDV